MEQRITDLAVALGAQLCALDAQVATAESCTGGGLAEAITRVSGSSQWFEAGYVSYSNRQKNHMLGVDWQLLNRWGAVSQQTVEAMALGVQQQTGARFTVATTGLAGPTGGTASQPVGTVWIGWRDGLKGQSQCFLWTGDRLSIRQQTVKAALEGLLILCQVGITV